MFSVIFEVLPGEGKKDKYLELAKHLKPILESIDGFVDNERFESQLRPGWVLSHSTWRDENSAASASGSGTFRYASQRAQPFPISRLWFGRGSTPTSFSMIIAAPRRTMPKKMSFGSGP